MKRSNKLLGTMMSEEPESTLTLPLIGKYPNTFKNMPQHEKLLALKNCRRATLIGNGSELAEKRFD